MSSNSNYPRIGDVYYVEFTGVGSVQNGNRPAVVFQNNVGNRYSPNVAVLPMTSKLKKSNQPTHVRQIYLLLVQYHTSVQMFFIMYGNGRTK